MATGGLYGSSGTGALIAQPGSESSGLYGNSTSFGGTYFEWFVFQTSETQPATPTGGTWNFTTNANTPPTGWSSAPPSNPLNTVWVSIAIVNSKNTAPLVWSVPGKFAFSSGLPILFGNGAPQPGDGQSDQLYIQLDTTPQTIWAKETGTWTRLTGSTLYADLTSNQTIAGTKTFSSQIQGSISGTASNVTGTVAISNGGTGATTAASARAALGAAELGANADITSMTGVTGGISTPDFVQFDTGITPTVGVGKLQWDPTHGCMQVGLVGGNVNLQIGEETVAYIYNNTGSTITEGQVVRVVGSQGQRLTVALAQANGDPNSATILGMATENIANNSSGFITTQGIVNNLNTSGFADGTLLYLSPTVPGGVTATKPVAPQHLVWIGYVVKGNSGGAGSIYIHTQNGYELDELHNVKITDPVADNSFLVYDATLEVWQNEAPSAARTSLGLGSAAVLNAGAANGVATLDAGGTVPLSQIPASIQGGVSYQGTWNATTNTPTLTSSVGTKGYYYVVSVAGSTNLNGITSWNIGDWAIYNGTAWEKIDNTDAVTSVNGYTGTVVLNYADVGAPSTTGVNATGTWGINVTGNAATATTAGSATTATTATNVSGGTASVTTLTTSSTVTLNGGTANGVAYLNGSKVLTTGSALTFDGANLQVGGGASGAIVTINGNANGGSLRGQRSGANHWFIGDTAAALGSGTGLINFVYGNDPFIWYNAGVAAEQMRLTSTGLGIGTSSPQGQLSLGSAASGQRGLTLDWTGAGGPYAVASFTADRGTGEVRNFAFTNFFQTWYTNNTERMRLDASGNLGLGVTPSAWGSTYKVYENPAGFIGGTGTNYLFVGSNCYADSGAFRYKNTAATTLFEAGVEGYKWRMAPSGTAGNAISFTQAMTLDASGNLALGATSAGHRLDVTGAAGTFAGMRINSTSFQDAGLIVNHATSGNTSALFFTEGGVNTGYLVQRGTAFGASQDSFIDLWNINSAAIRFGTANTERARIDSSGRLLLGGTSAVPLSGIFGQVINSTASAGTAYNTSGRNWILFSSTSPTYSDGLIFYDATAGVERARFTSTGGFSLGTTVDAGAGNISMADSKFIGWGNLDTLILGNSASNFIYFRTGGAEKIRINSAGDLLIGTTIAAGNSGSVGARKGSTGELILVANNGGLFHQAVSSYYLVTTTGGNTSDATLKKNVQQLSGALAKVCAIRGVNFEFIAEQKSTPDNGVQVGVIAQEVEAQYPEIVVTNNDGIKSVRYEKLVAPLIEAIKEQQAIIQTLTARVAALESN